MHLLNTKARWGVIAQMLHWVIAALIVAQFALITAEKDLPILAKLAALARHKSIGITILMLATVRLLWRASNPTPDPPNALKPYERALARFAHSTLYVLLFAIPITGWMMSSARNFPVSWFNILQLPDFVAPSRSLYEAMHKTHGVLAWSLFAIALLHVAAALKHHLVSKDGVLYRMLPFTRTHPE